MHLAFEGTSGRHFIVTPWAFCRDLLQTGCVSKNVRKYSVIKEPFSCYSYRKKVLFFWLHLWWTNMNFWKDPKSAIKTQKIWPITPNTALLVSLFTDQAQQSPSSLRSNSSPNHDHISQKHCVLAEDLWPDPREDGLPCFPPFLSSWFCHSVNIQEHLTQMFSLMLPD